MPRYFAPHYDVVTVGASLSTLAAAIALAKEGLKVLCLEQHNLPGGVATSFVRGGVEMEASLHEMMSVGTAECPRHARAFLDGNGANVDWVPLKECYRLVTPDIDFVLHPGKEGDFTLPAKEIADYCGDPDGKLFDRLMRFFGLCESVRKSSDAIYASGTIGKVELLRKHKAFVLSAGYTVRTVFNFYRLPKKAQDILSAYWVYLGTPMDECPFPVYAYLLADYIGYGSSIPRHTSHEMSLKMAMAAEKLGVQVEYGQAVSKIIVNNGAVCGVIAANGEIITADYVVCGAYPNTAFTRLIEPLSEVPAKAKKWVNGMEVGVSCFSVILLLDQTAEELGIKDYACFLATEGMDSLRSYHSSKGDIHWDYLTSVCPNVAIPDASKEGTCLYSITAVPSSDSFKDVTAENYQAYKDRHIERFLDIASKHLGFDLRDHILEIVVETPLTISHYTGAYRGAIYGYRHSMGTHIVSRTLLQRKERFIHGLSFAGAHQIAGDGMAPVILNGRTSAKEILGDMHKDGRKRK